MAELLRQGRAARPWRPKLQSVQPLPELPAGFSRVRRIENGGDGADPRRTGLQNFIEVAQGDSTYGKPWNLHVRRRPADVIQSDGRDTGLGRRGKDRADGNISRLGGDGAQGLGRRVGAQANGRGAQALRRSQLRAVRPAGVKKIFLAKMAQIRAHLAGHVPIIINDKADAGALQHGNDFVGETANFVSAFVLGAELNEIGAAVAKLAGDVGWWAASQPGGINKRIESALPQRLHTQACSSINSRRAPPRSCSRKLVE